MNLRAVAGGTILETETRLTHTHLGRGQRLEFAGRTSASAATPPRSAPSARTLRHRCRRGLSSSSAAHGMGAAASATRGATTTKVCRWCAARRQLRPELEGSMMRHRRRGTIPAGRDISEVRGVRASREDVKKSSCDAGIDKCTVSQN